MRRILAILLENEAGSLSRIVGLFSQRAFNIESLTVAPDPQLVVRDVLWVAVDVSLDVSARRRRQRIDHVHHAKPCCRDV